MAFKESQGGSTHQKPTRNLSVLGLKVKSWYQIDLRHHPVRDRYWTE